MTAKLMSDELDKLGATEAIIEAECAPSQCRKDGQLKADARMDGPGIVVYITCPAGNLVYPCDTYLSWQANFRAIALSLEALRAVARHGVVKGFEQYKGWTCLEYKPAPSSAFASRDDAAKYLVNLATERGMSSIPPAGAILQSPAIRKAFRAALLAVTAPDRNDGSDGDFKMVNEAFDKIGTT